MRNIKWSKIGQFSQVVKELRDYCEYHQKPLPTVTVDGSIKLHGTNIGLSYDNGDIYIQTRNNVCDLNGLQGGGKKQDSFGFDFFVRQNEDTLREWLERLAKRWNSDMFTVFGEWAGKSIQQGVAIAELEKTWYVFGAYNGDNETKVELDINAIPVPDCVEHIEDYDTPRLVIDFSRPEALTQQLEDITLKVEEECPVGAAKGVKGVGEGVVWRFEFDGNIYRFKVKGTKHSVSKVKRLVTHDPAVVKAKEDFVEYAVTENRVLQGMRETGANSREQTGDFMRWIAKDIIAEETYVLDANNLVWKDVAGAVSKAAVKIYHSKINQL